MNDFNISLGIASDPISDQLDKQKIGYDKEKIKKAQRYLDMINELRMAGILTDNMTLNPVQKSYKRLKHIIIEAIII